MRRRRGVTVLEVLLGSSISLLLLSGLVGMTRVAALSWYQTDAEVSSKQVLSLATARMAPSIRAAMRVNIAGSGSNKVSVVLPRIDTATGTYKTPLEAGDTHTFYLSNATGSPTAQGTLLWRAVNGVPDTGWSLRSGRGALDLRTAGLTFAYSGDLNDPRGVQVTLVSQRRSGLGEISRTAVTEIFLRNRLYR
jgi:hypothetical protein